MGNGQIPATSAALGIAMLLVFLMIGLWDICVTYFMKSTDTVSNVLSLWGRQFPILPLFVGLLLGHIFWPRSGS